MNKFDAKTIEKLKYYVYVLIDPVTNIPFYIGKGIGNRVFSHVKNALKKTEEVSDKYDVIRRIVAEGNQVKHLIVRHGLETEEEAFEIEATLIDFGEQFGFNLTNEVDGHDSAERGIMTTDEIIRAYNAEPLKKLTDPAIIININRKYTPTSTSEDIYEFTRKSWVVAEKKTKTIKYALSEYQGIIVEVFEIDDWFEIEAKHHKISRRWGFNGRVAKPEIREKYMNKSIAHTKKKGAANPIKYKL